MNLTMNYTATQIEFIENNGIIDYEMEQSYELMLDDCYPMINICGHEYEPSRALKEVDPIAFRVGFSDYCSEHTEYNIENSTYYLTEDGQFMFNLLPVEEA